MKTYMIVTNDEYELTVKPDIKGAAEAAHYLGLSVNTFRKNLCFGRWNHLAKYKAVVDESVETDREANRRAYDERYRKTKDRSEYFRRRYREKKGMAV